MSVEKRMFQHVGVHTREKYRETNFEKACRSPREAKVDIKPPRPPFQRWGSFCFPPQAKATPPTLKWGHGGFTPRAALRNSLKPVSHYFFPGMDPKMLKHLFFNRQRMTEVVSNRCRNAGLRPRGTRPACVKAPPRSVAYATRPL